MGDFVEPKVILYCPFVLNVVVVLPSLSLYDYLCPLERNEFGITHVATLLYFMLDYFLIGVEFYFVFDKFRVKLMR